MVESYQIYTKNARTIHITKCELKSMKNSTFQVRMCGRIRSIKMSFKFIFIILIVFCCVALIQHVHMYIRVPLKLHVFIFYYFDKRVELKSWRKLRRVWRIFHEILFFARSKLWQWWGCSLNCYSFISIGAMREEEWWSWVLNHFWRAKMAKNRWKVKDSHPIPFVSTRYCTDFDINILHWIFRTS